MRVGLVLLWDGGLLKPQVLSHLPPFSDQIMSHLMTQLTVTMTPFPCLGYTCIFLIPQVPFYLLFFLDPVCLWRLPSHLPALQHPAPLMLAICAPSFQES